MSIRDIDDVLQDETGRARKLDNTEHASRRLFLNYLDAATETIRGLQ